MERGGRGLRYASPPRNNLRPGWHEDQRRVERIRHRARSLSPPRQNSRRAVSKRDEPIEFSDGRRETAKEKYPKYSVNNRDEFRRSSIEATRDDEFRRSSIEVAPRDDFSRRPPMEAIRDDIREPSNQVARDDIMRPPPRDDFRRLPFDARSEDEFRQTLVKASREVFANPDELSRSVSDRQHSRNYSPSHRIHCDEDIRHSYFPHGSMNNAGIGNDAELSDHNKKNNLFSSGLKEGTVSNSYGMLVKKSIVLKDGTVHTFFTLPPDTSDPLCKPESYSTATDDIDGRKTDNPYSIRNLHFGSADAAGYRKDPGYFEADNIPKLQYSKLSHGEVFDKEDRELSYSRTAVYPINLPHSKMSSLHNDSSKLPIGSGHRDSLPSCLENLPCNGKLCDASPSKKHIQRDLYGKENENDLMLHIENLSTNDLGPHSRRGGVASYTENVKRDGSDTSLMWHDSYHNYNHSSQREESLQHGSVRSCLDILKTGGMENTTKFTTDGNMCKPSSLRAISSDLQGEPFRSRRGCLSLEVSRSLPTRHVREEHPFSKDVSVVDCRETARNRLLRSNLSPLLRSELPIRESDLHGPVKRVLKRKYIDKDNHRGDLQRRWLNHQDDYRKLPEMHLNENGWRDQEGTSRDSIRSGRSFHDEGFHRVSDSRSISVNNMWGHLSESKPSVEISSPQKRMRSNWHYDDNSVHRKGAQHFHHPRTFLKHNCEYDEQDRSWNRYHEKNDVLDADEPVQQSDLPEDSEAFKQQVQKAFLRFAKVLNENPVQRKRYEEKGKSGCLRCIVCSRLSKEYVDTHSLVMHAFNSKKVGLRAEHLGLHKALCVLMGWNYAVAPENAKVYQSLPAPDARAMTEDLILWPPLVIIHTPSLKKKQHGSEDVISNLEMDDILRGLGFTTGKSKPVDHSSANQGTFVVKFFPTFTGLQEAERLHKYCEEKHRGRNDWLQVQSLNKTQQNVGKHPKLLPEDGKSENGRIFYGYIGIARDLEKVDSDMRKRSLVKSRKDIEAIADGPVVGV